MELARRTADLQERQVEFQMRMSQQELDLRREAQAMEFELRRLALDRADANEKATNDRLANADRARMNFAHRGQTFAMWLAGGVAVPLITAGLVCILLAVAGVIHTAVGLPAGGILLAGGLFAGIANLVGHFLPHDKEG